MKQPRNNPSQPSNSHKTTIIVVLVLMGLGILLLIGLLLYAFRGSLPSLKLAEAATPFPTMVFPTPDCGSPALVIGSTTFQIQNTSLAADGTVSVPPGVNGVAYWVEGTDLQYTFLLSPTPENIALVSSLPEGTAAKATWTNCNSMTFTLSAPQPGTLGTVYLPDQSTASMVLFVQTDAAGNGLMTGGGMLDEPIGAFNTPVTSEENQAEIILLSTAPSTDGLSLNVTVSVHNLGTAPLTLSENDILLTQTDGAFMALKNSKPGIPRKIRPRETETFELVFDRPSSPTASLMILTAEYGIEGY